MIIIKVAPLKVFHIWNTPIFQKFKAVSQIPVLCLNFPSMCQNLFYNIVFVAYITWWFFIKFSISWLRLECKRNAMGRNSKVHQKTGKAVKQLSFSSLAVNLCQESDVKISLFYTPIAQEKKNDEYNSLVA